MLRGLNSIQAKPFWIALASSVILHFYALTTYSTKSKRGDPALTVSLPAVVFDFRTSPEVENTSGSNRIDVQTQSESRTPKKESYSASDEVTNRFHLKEYFESGDLTQLAEPVGEWMLNIEHWAPGTTITVRFEIWISRLGVIEKWKIIGDMAENIEIQKSLETIVLTVMNPALINGKPVPSYRAIEIDVSRDY